MNTGSLKFLAPGWFSVVMGLAGLSLAWLSAEPVLGPSATGVGLVMGATALLVFVALAGLSVVRAHRHRAALAEDLRHPVRHAFVATIPVSLLLLVAWAVSLGVRGGVVDALWWLASAGQFWATWWVLRRWLVAQPAANPASSAPPALQGLIQGAVVSPTLAAAPAFWPAVTPVLFIPVVGNVVVPLAGLALGHSFWSVAQLGAGFVLWPVVLTLLLVRRAVHGVLPERLLPTWFITVAPPSVIGLVMLQLQAPLALATACWGMALFFLLWAGSIAQKAIDQPFALTFWAVSFPLAAFTSLTLKLGVLAGSGGLQMAATLLLALTSLVVFSLCLGTWRGLRNGSLLAPEPVASLVPATV